MPSEPVKLTPNQVSAIFISSLLPPDTEPSYEGMVQISSEDADSVISVGTHMIRWYRERFNPAVGDTITVEVVKDSNDQTMFLMRCSTDDRHYLAIVATGKVN